MDSSAYRFCIDEFSLATLTADNIAIELESLAHCIVRWRPHGVRKSSAIWDVVVDGQSLATILFDRSSAIDSDTRQLLQQALSRSPDWDETAEVMVGLTGNVEVGTETLLAPSIEAAARRQLDGMATACISVSWSGPLDVVSAGGRCRLHFVRSDTDGLVFFRDIPEIEDLDEAGFFANASTAFPTVTFVKERTRFNRFQDDYRTTRRKVSEHLAVLNDHGISILSFPSDQWSKRFSAAGVDESGESSNTKADREAMKERQVVFGGRTLVCERHTKLHPTHDRIHYTVHEGRIVVGIFTDHLK